MYWVEVDLENGTVLPDTFSLEGDSREETILKIKTVHEKGLKVYLQLYPEWYGIPHEGELERGPVKDQDLFMEQMEEVALKWAEIAEELGVELYSPSCELNVFLSWDNNMRWHNKVLIE